MPELPNLNTSMRHVHIWELGLDMAYLHGALDSYLTSYWKLNANSHSYPNSNSTLVFEDARSRSCSSLRSNIRYSVPRCREVERRARKYAGLAGRTGVVFELPDLNVSRGHVQGWELALVLGARTHQHVKRLPVSEVERWFVLASN